MSDRISPLERIEMWQVSVFINISFQDIASGTYLFVSAKTRY